MHLKWKQKNIKDDLEFILFMQQDNKPDWWSKRLFEAYPSLDYEHAKKLSESDRLDYIQNEMKKLAILCSDDIKNSIKMFQETWETVGKKLNRVYSSVFGFDCKEILNDMVGFVGLDPVCPRDIQQHTFDAFYRFSPEYAVSTALHEITHFVWFHFWQKHFNDDPVEYDSPRLKWVLSEIVVETIIRNSEINDLIEQPKYIAYSYFYNMTINDELIFDTMKKLYLERKDIYDFMEKAYNWIKNNEPELRKKISKAESR